MQYNESFEETPQLPDKILKAEKGVCQNPYDIESWNVLLRDSQSKKIEDARPLYEKLIGQYPNSGRFWRLYLEHEMKAKCFDKVEKLFQRCLLKVFHIDIWKLYLSYIKESKVNLPVYREKMAQAYDFALDKIGMDINSYPIWLEYIGFLKSVEAVGSYAENQKISAVRKVYQKGILNPMVNIDLFWKDYCTFENSINPLIAKKMQEDRSRDYNNAKRVAKELETITKGINKNAPSVPPKNTSDEMKQVELWKKYIQWEKDNPLRTEDQTIITKRVMFAYEQCFLCHGLHPDFWIEAAFYLEESSRALNERGSNIAGKMFAEEASGIYERALSVGLKNCLLIYFAYADMEESRMKYDKVHSIYKRALELKGVETTLVYIQYMRFARRAEGIKSARAVFKRAREDSRIKYHVYVTAARMEHFCSKDSGVALKIFELAFKKFGGLYDFVKEFLEYSVNVTDDNNTRVLYERILTTGVEPHELSLDIWNKFVEFEANVGSLSSIFSSEKRRLQVFGKEFEGKETSLVIDRYKFLDLFPCNPTELKAMGLREPAKSSFSFFPTISNSTENGPEQNHANKDFDENCSLPHQKGKVFHPDISQMMPFKPKINTDVTCPVPGGVFAQPPSVQDFVKCLPPPYCFSGPFVRVDQFMESMVATLVPEDCSQMDSESDPRRADQGTLHSISISNLKRRRTDSADDEDDITPVYSNPFLSRRQKRHKF